MKKIVFLLSFLIVSNLLATQAFCEDNSPTQIIERGLNAYKKFGAKAAVKAWIQGSAIEGSKEALSQANNLRQIEDFYGKYDSFEIIKINKITEKVNIVSLVINYQNGPLFARFDTFKNNKGQWVVPTFSFNTKITQIFPPEMVFGN